jgi:hypothetical protein
MRRDFVKNKRAQRLHVYCFLRKKKHVEKYEIIYKRKNRKYEQMCKLSSYIDLLKTTVSKRHSNYCGLKKNWFCPKNQKEASTVSIFYLFVATWPILGAILDPAKSQEGVPKIMFLGIMLEK